MTIEIPYWLQVMLVPMAILWTLVQLFKIRHYIANAKGLEVAMKAFEIFFQRYIELYDEPEDPEGSPPPKVTPTSKQTG